MNGLSDDIGLLRDMLHTEWTNGVADALGPLWTVLSQRTHTSSGVAILTKHKVNACLY